MHGNQQKINCDYNKTAIIFLWHHKLGVNEQRSPQAANPLIPNTKKNWDLQLMRTKLNTSMSSETDVKKQGRCCAFEAVNIYKIP